MQEAWKQQGHEVDNKRIKLESLSIHDRGHSLSPREVKQVKWTVTWEPQTEDLNLASNQLCE